jgi:hypothetical protein
MDNLSAQTAFLHALCRTGANRVAKTTVVAGVHLVHGVISLAVHAADWVGSSHPEITPPSNFHQLRDMTCPIYKRLFDCYRHPVFGTNEAKMKRQFLLAAAMAAALMLGGCDAIFGSDQVIATVTGPANVRDAPTTDGSKVIARLEAGTELKGKWTPRRTGCFCLTLRRAV